VMKQTKDYSEMERYFKESLLSKVQKICKKILREQLLSPLKR